MPGTAQHSTACLRLSPCPQQLSSMPGAEGLCSPCFGAAARAGSKQALSYGTGASSGPLMKPAPHLLALVGLPVGHRQILELGVLRPGGQRALRGKSCTIAPWTMKAGYLQVERCSRALCSVQLMSGGGKLSD